MKDILKGELVRLSALDHEETGKALSSSGRDSELMRLLGLEPVRLYSAKATAKFFEKLLEGEATNQDMHHLFSIRALADNRLLGDVGLDVINNWGSRDSFVGIGVYDRNDWGQGYGTDAMNLTLGFAFTELNLRRVTLTVFEYNQRAIRSYEKAGFRYEGRTRGRILKDGKRWDMLFMGILYEEWLEKHYDKGIAS